MTHRGAQTATPEKEGINHIALSNTHTHLYAYTLAQKDTEWQIQKSQIADTQSRSTKAQQDFEFSLNDCNMTTEPLASTLKHRDTLQASPTDPKLAYGSSPLSSESSSNAKEID